MILLKANRLELFVKKPWLAEYEERLVRLISLRSSLHSNSILAPASHHLRICIISSFITHDVIIFLFKYFVESESNF